MGHGIMETDKMFSVKERPWHGLGTVIQEAPSVKEGLKLAGLDWKVEARPIMTDEESPVKVSSHRAIVRDIDNMPMGIVGANYRPLQNDEAFNWFEPLVEDGLVELETAGSLFNGKKIFILANTKGIADVVKDDAVESFILLSNAHDGTQAVRVGFTPIRVVCNNTLTSAHNSDLSRFIRIKHSHSVVENLEMVRGLMDTVNKEFLATIEQYQELAKRDIVKADLDRYVRQVFSIKSVEQIIDDYEERERIEKFRKKLMEKIEYYFDLEPAHKTWNMYNAVNGYLNHERGRNLETRYNSTWFGDNRNLDRKAFALAVNSY